jgi:hypothetical protein
MRKGSTYSTFIQYGAWVPRQNNKAGERNKRDTNRKGEVKFSLFADDTILYVKDYTKKLLYLKNTFGSIAGCIIDTENSVASLYDKTNRLRKKSGKQSHSQ